MNEPEAGNPLPRPAGAWAAMPLPWNVDDSLDAGLLRELVARYAAAGIDGVYCTGTDGEFHVLDFDEFAPVVSTFARAAADAGLPAQVGVGWLHERGVIQGARHARDCGVTTVQVAPPFWVPLNDDELDSFFASLSAVLPDVGLVVYHTTHIGRPLGPDDYRRLSRAAPTVVGSKYDVLDGDLFRAIAGATPQLAHFVVDAGIGLARDLPTPGVYCFMTDICPRWTAEWWAAYVRGDWAEVDRRRELLGGFVADWEAMLAASGITASPSMAKIAARAGIAPEMPLRVRAPYRAGTEADVAALRRLLQTRYPELMPDA